MMTEPIDSNLDLDSPKFVKRGLNGFLLAAYLLIIFGSGRLSSLYKDMYSQDTTNHYVDLLIIVVMLAGGAWLSDRIRQTRLMNIAGTALLIVLGIVTAWTDILTGYPLRIFYFLALGLLTKPLLKRLLTDTLYFSTAQKTIFIAQTAVITLSSFMFRALWSLHGTYSETGNTVVACVLLAIALILLLVDKEPELSIKTMEEYRKTTSTPLSVITLVLIFLVSLVTNWASTQANFAVIEYHFVTTHIDLITPFASMVITMGIVALFIYALQIKSPFVYIGTGAVILALLITIFITMGTTADNQWFFIILTGIGVNLVELGVLIWICRYTDFPFFTLVLCLMILAEELSNFLISAGLDLKHLFLVQNSFLNF